jgi:uncharacterized protein YqkB
VAHKLNYSFPCAAGNRQLSVRLIEGDDDFSLASTATNVAQSTSIVFRLGSRPPQLEIMPDRNALLPDSCRLNINYSSLDLDPTLLLSSSNALIGKVRLLAEFKTRLNAESRLPERYKTVQTLKGRLNDQIVEDTFKCQDLASNGGIDADTLCPLNDQPTWACKTNIPPQTGELGFILDRIKQNSCLYSDLEQGLPGTVQCSKDGASSLCLEGVKKAAELAEMEYQKSRGAAKRLVDALSIEKTRIASRQAELAKKISLVMEALNKGLAETENPVTPPAGGETPGDGTPVAEKVIYNGETSPFSFGQGWDITQSTVAESSAAPSSGTKHLRFKINNENWWGAAAYIWANFAPVDLSKYRQLIFKAKATVDLNIKAFLVAIETNSESTYIDFALGTNYRTFVIDLQKLKADGFDLSLPQGLVIATTSESKAAYTIDLDDLKAIP